MNYLNVYFNIVNNSKSKKRNGYLELHHVVPKCIFGEKLLNEDNLVNVNQDSNLVYLTAREHFICHWLLHRAFPKNKKLGLAFWAMAGMTNSEQKRYIPSSRAVAEARVAANNARKTAILQYDLEGNFLREYKSLNAASDSIGIVPNAIGQNLNSFTKSAGERVAEKRKEFKQVRRTDRTVGVGVRVVGQTVGVLGAGLKNTKQQKRREKKASVQHLGLVRDGKIRLTIESYEFRAPRPFFVAEPSLSALIWRHESSDHLSTQHQKHGSPRVACSKGRAVDFEVCQLGLATAGWSSRGHCSAGRTRQMVARLAGHYWSLDHHG